MGICLFLLFTIESMNSVYAITFLVFFLMTVMDQVKPVSACFRRGSSDRAVMGDILWADKRNFCYTQIGVKAIRENWDDTKVLTELRRVCAKTSASNNKSMMNVVFLIIFSFLLQFK